MQQHPMFAEKRSDLRNVLNCADFTVDCADRDHEDGWIDGSPELFKVKMAARIHGDLRNFETAILKFSASRRRGFVVSRPDQNLTALKRKRAASKPGKRKVVCFGCSRCEDDFVRIGRDQTGYLRG